MYGLSVEDVAEAGETPWGVAVEEKYHAWEVWHHLKGFVWDGASSTALALFTGFGSGSISVKRWLSVMR
jgi:hypothetical protein